MKKSVWLRAGVVVGVAALAIGPLSTTVASAAKKHHKKPAPVTQPTPGPSVQALGDLTETSTIGAVGFALAGAGWFANESIELASPGLASACPVGAGPGGAGGSDFIDPNTGLGGAGNPLAVTTDFSGTFNVAVIAAACAPGDYLATAQEVLSPNRVATTTLVITAPTAPPAKPSVTLSPSSETETGTSGAVAGTVILAGLPPNEPYTIASPTLDAACVVNGGATVGFPIDPSTVPGSLGTGATGQTDFAGYDIDAFIGLGCNAGTYPISVTENGAGHQEFDANFTVKAP